MHRVQALILALAVFAGLATLPAAPARAAGEKTIIDSDTKAKKGLYPIAVPAPADFGAEGLSIEPQKWKDVGAFGVVKAKVERQGGNVKITAKLYEIDKGAVA